MSVKFQGQFQITGISKESSIQWFLQANITFPGNTALGFGAADVQVGDMIVVLSSNPSGQLHRLRVSEIVSVVDADTIQLRMIYDDTGTSPTTIASGTGCISTLHNNTEQVAVSGLWAQISEYLPAYVNDKNAEAIRFPNNKIQGQSGFAAHELDGSNNDVNSFIEWNDTDQTHYHRVEPKAAAQDLDIKIGFQFPSFFTGLKENGNAFEFYGFANDGSTSGVNYLELITLVDIDGTEYPVSGKQITNSGRTLLTLTKTEVDAILNPITSSSSSSFKEWGTADAGEVIYARYKLFGDSGDNIYLDQDNAFMFIESP